MAAEGAYSYFPDEPASGERSPLARRDIGTVEAGESTYAAQRGLSAGSVSLAIGSLVRIGLMTYMRTSTSTMHIARMMFG